MKNDINVIVDVEPNEVELLIGLIETLLKDWYVACEEKLVLKVKLSWIQIRKQLENRKLRKGNNGKQSRTTESRVKPLLLTAGGVLN